MPSADQDRPTRPANNCSHKVITLKFEKGAPQHPSKWFCNRCKTEFVPVT